MKYPTPTNPSDYLNGIIRPIKDDRSKVDAFTNFGIYDQASGPLNVLDFDQNNNQWISATNCNYGQFVQIDFFDRLVNIETYVVKSGGSICEGNYMAHWMVSGSNDNQTFIPLDVRISDQTFASNDTPYLYYPITTGVFKSIRFTATGPRVGGKCRACVGALEFFGSVTICGEDCTLYPKKTISCSTQESAFLYHIFLLISQLDNS